MAGVGLASGIITSLSVARIVILRGGIYQASQTGADRELDLLCITLDFTGGKNYG